MSARLLALDVFRGLTVLLMLFVNNQTLYNPPSWLGHAPFASGVYLADWVFPWFLLAMGVAIPFSRRRFLASGRPEWLYEVRILRRVALLFLLGLGLSSLSAGHLVFTLDVLQLIALAYWLGAWLYDLPPLRRGVLALLLLLVYEAALLLVPVPGVGQGVYREEANLMRHLNATYLAPLGLRGVFSAIPTGALVLFGTLVGEALGRGGRGVYPLAWAALVLGLALRLGLPYDKTYWTPPYILVTAGVGTMLLGLLRGLDSRPLFGLKAVQALGANPLLAYLLPVAFKVGVLIRVRVGQEPLQDLLLSHLTRAFGPVWGGWALTLGYIGFWWGVLYLLYRRGILLRV
ncbi:MAG: DUF5009 domain-containing protein [Thermus sp.]